MSTATVESMVAKATQLRANNALYRTHNAQLAVARAAECQQCQGTGLHPDQPKGLCPTCRGRRTR
jgi:DnaJ-class molecular chaperone